MFGLKCGHHIATSAVASRGTEFVAIRIQFPSTRGKPVRESRNLCLYRRQNTLRRLRSFRLCKSVLPFLLFVSFVCFVGLSENGEIDDGNNSEPEEKRIGLQVAHLEQTQECAESPCAAARTTDHAGIDDPAIEKC